MSCSVVLAGCAAQRSPEDEAAVSIARAYLDGSGTPGCDSDTLNSASVQVTNLDFGPVLHVALYKTGNSLRGDWAVPFAGRSAEVQAEVGGEVRVNRDGDTACFMLGSHGALSPETERALEDSGSTWVP